MPYPDNRPDIDYHDYFAGALAKLHADLPKPWSEIWQRRDLPFKARALAAE